QIEVPLAVRADIPLDVHLAFGPDVDAETAEYRLFGQGPQQGIADGPVFPRLGGVYGDEVLHALRAEHLHRHMGNAALDGNVFHFTTEVKDTTTELGLDGIAGEIDVDVPFQTGTKLLHFLGFVAHG